MSLDYSWSDSPDALRIQGPTVPSNGNVASVDVTRHSDAANMANEGVPAPGPALETRPLVLNDGEHVGCFYNLSSKMKQVGIDHYIICFRRF